MSLRIHRLNGHSLTGLTSVEYVSCSKRHTLRPAPGSITRNDVRIAVRCFNEHDVQHVLPVYRRVVRVTVQMKIGCGARVPVRVITVGTC